MAKPNETIKEEDSAMFDTSQIDINKEIELEDAEKYFYDNLPKQTSKKLEELKIAYKQKRLEGRARNTPK
jgi:hypothetical protein